MDSTSGLHQENNRSSAAEPDENHDNMIPPPPEPQESDGLLFINITGPVSEAKSDVVSQRKIKVHARRHTLRSDRRHSPSTVITQPPIGVDSSKGFDQKAYTSRFKLSTWSRKPPSNRAVDPGSHNNPIPSESRDSTTSLLLVEPSAVDDLPIPLTPAVRIALNFYHNDLRTNSFAINHNGTWFDFARSDPLCLYGHLTVISSHRNIMLGIEDRTDEEFFRAKTIRLINLRLSEERESKLSEGLLAGVAAVVNREAVNGSYERATIHMGGLAKMIDFNGGLETLNHNKVLQRVITWSDFCYASNWGKMPYFPIVSSLSDAFRMSDRFLSKSFVDSLRFSSSDIIVTDRGVFEALEQVFSITEAITSGPSQGDREAISNSIYLVEHRLAMMNFGEGVENVPTNKIDLSKALALATHLFLHLGIRELPAGAQRYQLLFRRLESCLPYEKQLLRLESSPFSIDLLLWTFFVAGANVFDDSSRPLLMLKLQQLCFLLGIRDRNDFDAHLKNILWMDPFSSSQAETLWDEMERFSTG